MIINEQHDLDKAKENVYILQRGLLTLLLYTVSFYSSARKQILGITIRLRYRWLKLNTQNEVYE